MLGEQAICFGQIWTAVDVDYLLARHAALLILLLQTLIPDKNGGLYFVHGLFVLLVQLVGRRSIEKGYWRMSMRRRTVLNIFSLFDSIAL